MCSNRKIKLEYILTPKITLKLGRKCQSFNFNQPIAQLIFDEISNF